MQVDVSIVIGLMSFAFSIGAVVGLFGQRFVAKKECSEKMDCVWTRVDAIQDLLTGGKYTFEVRLIPKNENSN